MKKKRHVKNNETYFDFAKNGKIKIALRKLISSNIYLPTIW